MAQTDDQKVVNLTEDEEICIINADQERDILWQRTRIRSQTKAPNLSTSTVVGRKRKGCISIDSEEQPTTRKRTSANNNDKTQRKHKKKTISYMELLSDCLILEIFQHLPKFPTLIRLREVSQRWNRLVSNSRLWTSLSFEGNEHINSANLNALCKIIKLNKLRNLSLAKVHGIDEISLRTIPRLACASTLESVDLSWCSGASDRSVVEFSRCPGLRVLKLSHCRLVSRRSVRILAVRCPRLEVLDMNCISGLRDSLLQFIGQNCPYLKVLNIANGKNITDSGLNFIANGCFHLTKLDVSWCERVSDESMMKIAGNLTSLREIGLAETCITDASLKELAKHCIKLECIHVARCSHISDVGVLSIVEVSGKRLRNVNLASCPHVSDQCVKQVIKQCTALHTLDVSKRPCRAIAQLLIRHAEERNIEVYF